MVGEVRRPLKVFLCHASGDKLPVREFYKRLVSEGVDAWLDQEKLLPGQDWRVEIPHAVEEADVVIVFLSKKSITKEGYVQKEIKFALDIAEEKPEGTIFLIPARIEECAVPERLSRWQWVDLYEENGYAKLLRSLKLRAEKAGAVIESAFRGDTDKELGRRLDQLYTEGLAAFWVDDWERACERFRAILAEQPNHRGATEKLAEAERQRELTRLYTRSLEAIRSENWQAAVQTLEELCQKSADYKDVAQLLKNARLQRQLKELYSEARTLRAGEQWRAVVKVFDQIHAIDPAYSDPENLLDAARKEVDELNRLAELNDLYSHAVREMDAGQWVAARTLLEGIHKSQTGFLETERLLRKAEAEIEKLEADQQRNDHINTLYEQAHGLMRSKKWRKALEKIEEIKALDDQFFDRDEIFGRAKVELDREEGETRRQNELAAMYAEAVRLLKEEKYQDALDKWQEVKAFDPKYPDRQSVQRVARRKLTELGKPLQVKARILVSRSLWGAIAGIVAIAVVIAIVVMLIKSGQKALPSPTLLPTQRIIVNPPGNNVPYETITLQPPTLVPIQSGYTDPTMYDDFENPAFNGRVNPDQWNYSGDIGTISQEAGMLKITLDGFNTLMTLAVNKNYNPVTAPIFIEAKMMLDPNSTKSGTDFGIGFSILDGWSNCSIFAGQDTQTVTCWSHTFGVDQRSYMVSIPPGTWHILRVEMYPDKMKMNYVVDGKSIGSYIHRSPDSLKDQAYGLRLYFHNFGDIAKSPTCFLDYVKIGRVP